MIAAHDIGIVILRSVLGLVFVMHGSQKLFSFGFAGVGATFAKLGIPMPEVAAIVVTLVEFLGGLAILLGLGTRIAAALIAITMLVATFKVHWPAGFYLPNGYEFALTLFGASLALAMFGGGKYSLDWQFFDREKHRY